jgi:type IV pilus assembly protein PilC
MSDQVLADFYRKLAAMLDTGMAPTRCLDTLSGQSPGPLRRALIRMRDDISGGSDLATAAASHPSVIRPLHVQLLRSGERSGSMTAILKRLADALEKAYRVRKAFVGKLIYPVLLVHAAIFIPAVVKWLGPGGTAATAIKHILMSLIPLYIVAAVLLFGIGKLRKIGALRLIMDGVVSNIPVVGRAYLNIAIARFVQTLELLYVAGVNMRESVAIATQGTGNAWVESRLKRADLYLAEGEDVGTALGRTGVFNPMVQSMIATGVESGQLDEMLRRVGDQAEHDAATSIDRLAVVMPFLLYFVVMIAVGAMILSMWGAHFSQINDLLK